MIMDYTKNVKKFYDGYRNKLITEFAGGNVRVVEAIKFIKSYLFQANPKKIIDIGCGIGWTTYEFGKSYPNSLVVGVDISDKLVEVASNIF
jgi:ubiquinone/menaquinone biosynthesis C-methylase UbiE